MLRNRVKLLRCFRTATESSYQNKFVIVTSITSVRNGRELHIATTNTENSPKSQLFLKNKFLHFTPTSSSPFSLRHSSATATAAGAALALEGMNKQSSSIGTENIATASASAAAPSTTTAEAATNLHSLPTDKSIVNLADLPEVPTAPSVPVDDVVVQGLNAAGEPTLESIGLGGWSPVGLIQHCMEFLHVSWDLPWWCAIAIGTLVVRTIIFPLVILAQRNAAKMNNNLPQMQVLQLKMSEARQTGNAIDSARYAQELMMFMKQKNVNPLKNMIVPLAQAPLFISFFMSLRGMANAPVDSMREGGIFWFTDLTIADPTFILPVITSATLFLTIEVGTDSARLSAQNMQTMKYILRALPIAIFPFTMNFPAAILTYWACSNFISLGQVALLKIPTVREYFKIDKLVTHESEKLPMKKKGFVEGMKDSWQNMKITRELEERQRLDQIRFDRAGTGPVIKTYKYDPTKPRSQPTATGSSSAPISAKQKTN